MKKLTLVLNYAASTYSPTVGLEQEPVADNTLTTTDLYSMIAMVKSGKSAKLYKPETCNVSIIDGKVLADLIVYSWPKPYDLDYTTVTNYGEIKDRISIKQSREFDFIINMSTKIELPFIVESISYETTQLPFFNNDGEVVPEPVITFDERFVYVSSEVIGVIRLTCVAKGYSHIVSLSFDKGDSNIDNVNISVSSNWYYGGELNTETLSLELPGCLALLLKTCEDDLITERNYGSVKGKDTLIPVVYYSDCDGSFLTVRYEKP